MEHENTEITKSATLTSEDEKVYTLVTGNSRRAISLRTLLAAELTYRAIPVNDKIELKTRHSWKG